MSGPAQGGEAAFALFHCKSVSYGAFQWARRARRELTSPKRRFPAVSRDPTQNQLAIAADPHRARHDRLAQRSPATAAERVHVMMFVCGAGCAPPYFGLQSLDQIFPSIR
jgi:hypothetical protein